MTTITSDNTSTIRTAFRANAAFSLVTGTVGLAAGGWVVDQLGLGEGLHILVRLIGAGLLGFAVLLLWEARQPAQRLVPTALQISVADFAWVLGTVALIVAGVFSTRGAIIAGLIAVVVDAFASLQLWGRHKALRAAG